MSTLTFNTSLETETCCNCGMFFAMPSDVYRARRNDHATFYCPSGHPQSYQGKSEAQQLRDQLAVKERERLAAIQSRDAANVRTENARQEAEHFRKSRDGIKGVLAKTKKRLVNATCPCCTRHFPTDKLAKHLATKHPDYAAQPLP